ncbi:methyltransferase domain-containing protein [Blastococcus deserti]|uniref:Arsenite methyltransferase n=1 Tax=Blastococcus deserti TaxID=2259033 RepID=A0ABW4XA86_9ACTN
MSTTSDVLVDAVALRDQVREKYRAVATDPAGHFHFHTGRDLARRLGYDPDAVSGLPDRAVESFAGVANPFLLRRPAPGERVVDVGSGAGFDSFLAAQQVGPDGHVIGVDMTPEMLDKARTTAAELRLENVEFRAGLAEALPVDDGWADVVISNGVINLCADKRAVLTEICRVLKPGGWLQFADIANGRPVPEGALRDIDLWTGWIAGGLPRAGWQKILTDVGFAHVVIGEPVDTFGGAAGETKARAYEVYGYPFLARKPL